MHKVIIIDDEQLAIDVIQLYLDKFPNYKVLKTFTDPLPALDYLKNNTIDIVFSDIEMSFISGLDIINLCKNKSIKFILVTSYSHYAVECFDLDVVDYLLKPVSFKRFTKAINRYESSLNSSNTNISSLSLGSFFIKDGDEYVKVFTEEIDYIEGMKDYVKIVCGKNFHVVLKTLKSLENLLASKDFIRVHKSYIIPLRKIIQYNGKCVLINSSEIPVGSSYRNNIKDFLDKNKL
ncbi:LytTR family DNA-binding domain-containing protein [Tenacibaculum sp. 190524A02b]|uniref:Two-component system, LytTR family, response regulator n=1 Tax=Tenacibaculum vairaonense TaxID=3137860 RepID=A0ABP1F7X6_9FLAO